MRKLQFSLEILSIADHTIEHRYLQFPKKQHYLPPMRHCHTVVMVIENFMYKISNKNILNWYICLHHISTFLTISVSFY